MFFISHFVARAALFTCAKISNVIAPTQTIGIPAKLIVLNRFNFSARGVQTNAGANKQEISLTLLSANTTHGSKI